MSWKQIKIFTADAEQSVMIEPNPEKDGMVMHTTEEQDKKSFMLYMTLCRGKNPRQRVDKICRRYGV